VIDASIIIVYLACMLSLCPRHRKPLVSGHSVIIIIIIIIKSLLWVVRTATRQDKSV